MGKLWYYGKNYGTMEKKLWHYTEIYGTLIYYGKKYSTMEKTGTIVNYSKLFKIIHSSWNVMVKKTHAKNNLKFT